MDKEEIRKGFEAWAHNGIDGLPYALDRNRDGVYIFMWTERMWQCWLKASLSLLENLEDDAIDQPFDKLPKRHARHVEHWLKINNVDPPNVRWRLYPMGMVGTFIERAVEAEEKVAALEKFVGRVREVADKVVSARTQWHEKYGVPVNEHYAQFLDAVGDVVNAARDICPTCWSPEKTRLEYPCSTAEDEKIDDWHKDTVREQLNGMFGKANVDHAIEAAERLGDVPVVGAASCDEQGVPQANPTIRKDSPNQFKVHA